MDQLLPGVDAAVAELTATAALHAADAIRTTDTVAKIAFRRGARAGYTVGGMAKGAGMLAPAWPPCSCVLTTDADVDRRRRSTRRCAARPPYTFDRLDSDGCMSTNDTVLLLASGASGVKPDQDEFAADAHRGLRRPGPPAAARRRGRDQGRHHRGRRRGERGRRGRGRPQPSPATTCSSARSHGEDPNWGRVLSAVGTTDAVFEPDRLDVAINGVWVCRAGAVGDDRVQGRPAAAATSRSPST